jgi:N-methylhydantoinase B
MTSIGREIEPQLRNSGCFRPFKILTKPGTIVHALPPAPTGNCTCIIAKQIIETVWACLAQVLPERTPAGWGTKLNWAFCGYHNRKKRYFGSPDFLGAAIGAGAVHGTDGYSGVGSQICSGTLRFPEIEVLEEEYPIVWERWEFLPESACPGQWRGGFGTVNEWKAEDEIYVIFEGDPYGYEPHPSIGEAQLRKIGDKKIIRRDGAEIPFEEIRRIMSFTLQPGDKVIDYLPGGCGVGDPRKRDLNAILDDVNNGLISIESASKDYGVLIAPDPKTGLYRIIKRCVQK